MPKGKSKKIKKKSIAPKLLFPASTKLRMFYFMLFVVVLATAGTIYLQRSWAARSRQSIVPELSCQGGDEVHGDYVYLPDTKGYDTPEEGIETELKGNLKHLDKKHFSKKPERDAQKHHAVFVDNEKAPRAVIILEQLPGNDSWVLGSERACAKDLE